MFGHWAAHQAATRLTAHLKLLLQVCQHHVCQGKARQAAIGNLIQTTPSQVYLHIVSQLCLTTGTAILNA